jgi:hypothetical protein
VALDHRLTLIMLRLLFIPLPVACCLLPVARVNSGVACYVIVGSGATSPRWRGGEGRSVDLPVTVAAAALVTSPLVGEGMPCIAQIRHNIFSPLKLAVKFLFSNW